VEDEILHGLYSFESKTITSSVDDLDKNFQNRRQRGIDIVVLKVMRLCGFYGRDFVVGRGGAQQALEIGGEIVEWFRFGEMKELICGAVVRRFQHISES
jgi:hypothetical protein